MPREQAAAMAGGASGNAFEVEQENWQAVCVFIACGTQWTYRATPNGSQIAGLNYPSVETMLRLYRVAQRSVVFDQIRTMELAALEVFRGKNV